MKTKNVSIKELMQHSPGIGQLWGTFVTSVNELMSERPKDAMHATIDATTLLGHSRIILEWLNDWAKNLLHEKEFIAERLKLANEIAETIIKEKNCVSRPNENGIVESGEKRAERIGYLKGMRESMQVSQEELAQVETQQAYQQSFSRAWEDMHVHIIERVEQLVKDFNLQEFGAQVGADYWRRKDQPYYSGPQNPPRKPTASPLIPGYLEDPSAEQCWCSWEMQYVPKPKSDNPNSKCEDFAHRCVDGEMRMLTTALKMPHDQRKPFNPNADFSGKP